MKNILLIISVLLITSTGFAQTATNFTCNDCAGSSHDLFTELNSGKVIVICWVMPCTSCISPSKTTYDIVQGYASSHPNKVFMYICDDFGTTPCSTISSWATQYAMPNTTKFSNPAIAMSDYGDDGMPKIVVIGGSSHSVYYTVENTVNTTSLQNAINSAIAATGISNEFSVFSSINVFPNPAKNNTVLTLNADKPAMISVAIYNMLGQKISTVFSGIAPQGESNFEIKTNEYPSGIYFVKIDDAKKNKMIKLIVSH